MSGWKRLEGWKPLPWAQGSPQLQRMISLSVSTTGINAMARFAAAAANQLPFATSLALNQTARDTQLALREATTTAFVNPVAFTRNAFRYSKSTKAHLVAEVYPSPDRPYFDPETFGGPRRWKDYEGFIRGLSRRQGQGLPAGKLVPTRAAINAAGNPKRQLFGEIESRLSTTDRGGFMIGTPRGGDRAPGVYRRSRGKLIPFFLVIDEPLYRPRFPMERVGQQTIARVFPSHLQKAVDRAIASAR